MLSSAYGNEKISSASFLQPPRPQRTSHFALPQHAPSPQMRLRPPLRLPCPPRLRAARRRCPARTSRSPPAHGCACLAALSSVGDESAMNLRRGASFFYGITMLLRSESELLRIHNSRTSENSVKKLSEKSWRCPNQGLTRVRMGTFRHRTPAKPALGGLLKPLFRQFHNGVLGSPHARSRTFRNS